MKRKNIDEIGMFNVLLIGENPHAISIADNIHSAFDRGMEVKNNLLFNIVEDIDGEVEWFHEFIFNLTSTVGRFNNIVISRKFKEWNEGGKSDMERLYMKKLLQAMNFVIIDISKPEDGVPTDGFGGGGGYEPIFDYDIPQCRFNDETDFLGDVIKWVDVQVSKIVPKIPMIRIIRSLCGKNIPYLGDVFGCLSGKKYSGIIESDKMRFEVPVLFDEFCALARGYDMKELESSVITRSNSSLSVVFK